jgi:hypothetical protein
MKKNLQQRLYRFRIANDIEIVTPMKIGIQQKHLKLKAEPNSLPEEEQRAIDTEKEFSFSSPQKKVKMNKIRRNDAITIEFQSQAKEYSRFSNSNGADGLTQSTSTGRVIAGICVKSRRKTVHVRSRYSHIRITYIIEKAMPALLAITPTKEWYSNFKDVHINAKRM